MSVSSSCKAKILVVEDDSFMQTILSMFLAKRFETDIAENGIEAVLLLQNSVLPSLIISDLNTPEMNGLELIKYLKANDHLKAIPIIILCGDDNPQQRQNCLQAGAVAFIIKPFNPVELGALIDKILQPLT